MSCTARLERNLVCVRKAPHDPDAEGGHVYESSSVPDRHDVSEAAAEATR